MRIVALLLLCVAACTAADHREKQGEKQQVIALVHRLFENMAAGNGDAVAAAMLPDVRLIAVRDGKISPASGRDDFVQRIAASKGGLLERIWSPTVLVRGQIAMLWADYDLHIGTKFSHCGVDAFFLLKTGDGWKISQVQYTAESQGCKPSPLGPVK